MCPVVRRLAPRTLLGSYAGQLVSVADGVRLRSAPAPYASGDQPSPSGWGQRVRVQPRPGRGARSGYVSVGPTCDVTRVRAHKPSAQCPPPPGLNRLAGACSTTSTSRGAANDATLASSLTSKASACTSRRWRCAIAHARCSQSVVWQSLTASCIAGRGRWRRASHQLWQRAAARQAGAGASTRPTRAHTASVVAVSNGPLTRAIRTPTSARSARAHRRRVLGARVRKS